MRKMGAHGAGWLCITKPCVHTYLYTYCFGRFLFWSFLPFIPTFRLFILVLQDQYPTEQNPIPGAKGSTTPSSIEASDTTTSVKGRPPRPWVPAETSPETSFFRNWLANFFYIYNGPPEDHPEAQALELFFALYFVYMYVGDTSKFSKDPDFFASFTWYPLKLPKSLE